MRAVVQRVKKSSVSVGGRIKGEIGHGLTVLIAAGRGDAEKDVRYMAEKIAGLRIFEDDEGKMNLSVKDVGGSVLAISQFTLYGDVKKGKRPGFSDAERPEAAEGLYEDFCERLAAEGVPVERGVFGADMLLEIYNDGPVTILIDSERRF